MNIYWIRQPFDLHRNRNSELDDVIKRTLKMIKAFISTTIAVVSAALSEAKSEETKGKSDNAEAEDQSVM